MDTHTHMRSIYPASESGGVASDMLGVMSDQPQSLRESHTLDILPSLSSFYTTPPPSLSEANGSTRFISLLGEGKSDTEFRKFPVRLCLLYTGRQTNATVTLPWFLHSCIPPCWIDDIWHRFPRAGALSF